MYRHRTHAALDNATQLLKKFSLTRSQLQASQSGFSAYEEFVPHECWMRVDAIG